VADELAVLQHYLTAFQPDQLPVIATALQQIDWDHCDDRPTFERSLTTLREQLQPFSAWLKERQIQLVGHAHLDLAWLWPVEETWRAAERTFKSVLQLQRDFPDLTFCHSTPALYDWTERNRPALFAAIQQQIASGRWDVVAGLWVEPEFNLVGGESLVRQVLYGQCYVQEKFGQVSAIAWLPDSFGFCWQLPQILVQGGVQYFVTQKMRWNDTNEFPHELFWWRSPDGTQILSFHSPRIGEGVDPLKMAEYACTWESKTGIPHALWLPGVGDHGGGPTRDMVAIAQRWHQSPFFPTLTFTTVTQYLTQISPPPRSQESGVRSQELEVIGGGDRGDGGDKEEVIFASPSSPPSPSLLHPTPHIPYPVWDDELYLEFHRGCYTTHADQKRSNRRCEILLYQAELFSSLATLFTAAPYPKEAIETAWKQVLFNQFHDILPGSSIPEVFVDANRDWQAAEQAGEQMLGVALEAIATHISLPEPPHAHSYPVFLFNSLNWSRSEVVSVPLPHLTEADQTWQLYDTTGQPLESQLQVEDNGSCCLRFLAKDIPGVGYQTVWLSSVSDEVVGSNPRIASHNDSPATEDWLLENEWLRVVVDPKTGDLTSVFDKRHQRESLQGPGNQLQAFRDQGQYWDAWNIDPHYAEHPLPPPELISIRWVERGAIASRLRVIRQIGQSQFYQDYVLEAASPLLKIVTTVNWQERQVLVKAAFPLTVEADHATYEMAFGAIQRPTRSDDLRDKAKWEVPALQWADLGEANYGVSLLNGCKYGYDSQPSQLRLTLLRSPNWPDPEADRGYHQFTYAVYPHAGQWQAANTVRRGYELNQPIRILVGDDSRSATADLPPTGTLLNLPDPNFVLAAFKAAEDHENTWILRGYECHGATAEFNVARLFESHFGQTVIPTYVAPANLLEEPTSSDMALADRPTFAIAPWKIASFRLSP
jgi:alpha-mannosidase